MLEWVIFFLSAVALYHWLNLKPKNFPPGPPTVPFLGSLPFIESRNFHLHLEKLKKKYGPIVGLKFGTLPAVAVCGPEQVLEVFKREDFSGRSNLIIKSRKSEGFMFANGITWREQRKFTLRHLRHFGFGKTTVADMMSAEVDEFCEKKLKCVKNIQVSGLFNISAINILWAMIAGTRLSYDDKNFKTLLNNLERQFRGGNVNGGILNSVPGLRKAISLVYEMEFEKSDRILGEFLKKTFEEHKANKTDTANDFMDVYIEELEKPNRGSSFTEPVFFEVIRDIFNAGTESSGNTVSFAIMYLVIYPEWQEKLIEEIDRVLGGSRPSSEDIKRLPLVEAFLSEVQRSNTIAPVSVPHATTEDTHLGGYFLPKDTFVHISIWSLLQDKDHWGDPEVFRPERFLNSEGKIVKDPYMVLFGTGPRVCPGESLALNFLFIFFVTLLQRYKFVLPKGDPLPSTLCKSGFTVAPQPFSADIIVR